MSLLKPGSLRIIPSLFIAVVSWHVWKEIERRTKSRNGKSDKHTKIAEELAKGAQGKVRKKDPVKPSVLTVHDIVYCRICNYFGCSADREAFLRAGF